MKVLVIEDDREIIEAISLAFQIRWPEAQVVSTRLGEKGVEQVETESPDIVILDLGLPDINGFEVLRQIRRFSQVPTIILTVRAEEVDIVKGLEWGADDYIVKPFRQLEFLSRVKALIRRKSTTEEEQLVSGPLRLDSTTGQLRYNRNSGESIPESPIITGGAGTRPPLYGVIRWTNPTSVRRRGQGVLFPPWRRARPFR